MFTAYIFKVIQKYTFQLFVYAHNPGGMRMTLLRDEYPDKPLTLKGLGRTYMPVLMARKTYTMHWSARAPADLTLRMASFSRYISL